MASEIDPGFAKRLESVMDALKITQRAFAESGGVSEQTMSGYMHGKRQPGLATLTRWVRTYKISGTWLLTGEGEMFSGEPKQEALEPQSLDVGLISARDIMTVLQQYVERVTGKAHAIQVGPTLGEPGKGVYVDSITIGKPDQKRLSRAYPQANVQESDQARLQEDVSDYSEEELPRASNDLKS